MPPPPLDIIVVAHIPSNPPFVVLTSLIYEFTIFVLKKPLVPIMVVVKHHQNIRANNLPIFDDDNQPLYKSKK